MTDHAHHYTINHYEDGVDVGTCKVPGCTAIRYYPASQELFAIARVKELNAQFPTTAPVRGEPVEPSPIPVTTPSKTRQRHALNLEQNKTAILADIESLGNMAARKKWHIRPSCWSGWRRRWGLPLLHPSVHPAKPASPPDTPLRATTVALPPLPPLPPWDPAWPPEVMLEWLEIFIEYARLTLRPARPEPVEGAEGGQHCPIARGGA